jgi:hypothetical protein
MNSRAGHLWEIAQSVPRPEKPAAVVESTYRRTFPFGKLVGAVGRENHFDALNLVDDVSNLNADDFHFA